MSDQKLEVNPVEVIAAALVGHQLSEIRLWDPFRDKYRKLCECGAAVDHGISAHQASVIAALPDIAVVSRGKRWYTAAYRADNGNIIPVGVEYVKPAWAEGVRDEWQRDEPNGKYFVAYRDVPDWQEVER